MLRSLLRFIGKLIGWSVLIFLIYFVLGCLNAAFQGIINQPDEDGGPSIKETWGKLFEPHEYSASRQNK